MKRPRLDLGSGMLVESYRDWNGRVFIGCRKGVSAMFGDAQSLRRFLQLPSKTPSRERLDAWLLELEPPTDRGGLSADRGGLPTDRGGLAATGFGPECHDALDASDPNHLTRTII